MKHFGYLTNGIHTKPPVKKIKKMLDLKSGLGIKMILARKENAVNMTVGLDIYIVHLKWRQIKWKKN